MTMIITTITITTTTTTTTTTSIIIIPAVDQLVIDLLAGFTRF